MRNWITILSAIAWAMLPALPLVSAGPQNFHSLIARKKADGGASYYSEVTTDTPTAYWRLGEASGTLDNDEGTAAYDMTASNSPTYSVASLISGDANTAMTFAAASSQYADVSSNLGITVYPVTFECWIKTTQADLGIVVSMADSTSPSRYFSLGVNGGVAEYRRRNTTQFTTAGTVTVNDGNPHHIVVVMTNATTSELFVDGVSDGTDANSVLWPTVLDRTSIGRFGDSTPSSYYDGTVDEVAIYAAALSSTRILAHYNAGK